MADVTIIKSAPFGVTIPPTQHELPCDDGVPMETQRHKLQIDLLLDALEPWLTARTDGYAGGNMFLYYSMAQVGNQDFRGPDVFVVLGVPKGERLSWVVWEEDKGPDVVIELLSESTTQKDKGEKKLIYQDRVRVPEYFWFDPFNPEDWAGFHIIKGVYEPIPVNEQGYLVSEHTGLALTRWQGIYKGVEAVWLRWTTLDGELLTTERELTEQAQRQAEQLAAQLRQVVLNLLQSGMGVEQVTTVTGLSIEQVQHLEADG